jgi:hypothetical protein
MSLLQPYTSFKVIGRPGKSRPAVFAFNDPRPQLRDFTKNIDAKAKPSTYKPSTGLMNRGFCETDVFGASPSHRPWTSALSATPARRALPYHAGYRVKPGKQDFFAHPKLRSCRIRLSQRKTTLEYQNPREKNANRGVLQVDGVRDRRSYVILAQNFLPKTRLLAKSWHRSRGDNNESRA